MQIQPPNRSLTEFSLTKAMEMIFKQRFLKEVIIIVSAYFAYMFSRALLYDDVEIVALDNARKLISFQTHLGFMWEDDLQNWLLTTAKDIVLFFNWSYIFTFFPIILPVAFIIYKLSYAKYIYYRNIVLLSLLIAVIVFAAFPLAPPRMLPDQGFVDTIDALGPSEYNSRENQAFYNPFAAMPSIHFAWTVLFGIIFFRTRIPILMFLGVLYPTLTFFSIIITGNHYTLDAAAGAGVLALAFVINHFLFKNNIPLNVTTFYHLARAAFVRRRPQRA